MVKQYQLLKIVSAEQLNNANGAFGLDTIYLSEEFLTENVANPEAVESVLLEEIGHFVDKHLGGSDSRGDEGDSFLPNWFKMTLSVEAELADLKAEDDSTTIGLDGEKMDVELAGEDSPYQEWILHTGTPISEDPAATEFFTGDYNGDGKSDLFSLAKSGTGTNSTEVHSLDGSNGN